MAEYLILKGDQIGNKRDFGTMEVADMKRRSLFLIEDYEGWKKLDEVGKAIFLANAQESFGIDVDKKKVIAIAATKAVKEAKVVEPIAEVQPIEAEEPTNTEINEPESNELGDLQKEYEEKFAKSVPARFKNDAEWIKSKLN